MKDWAGQFHGHDMTITNSGFSILRFPEIRDEFVRLIMSRIGPSIDLSNGSLIGQFISIFSLQLSQLWEQIEQLRETYDPDSANEIILDSIAQLSGLSFDDGLWIGTGTATSRVFGRLLNEQDSRLRFRREQSFAAPIKSNFDNLYNALISVPGVFDVAIDTTGFTNPGFTLVITPPVVNAVSDWEQGVADTLLRHVPAGTEVTGLPLADQPISTIDSKGHQQDYTITAINGTFIDIEVTVITDPIKYPETGDQLVAEAVFPPDGFFFEEGAVQVVIDKFGRDVIPSIISCRVIDSVPGVLSAVVLVDLSPNRLPIGPTDAARYQSDNIVVIS